MSASVKLFADISPTNQRKKLQLIDAIRTNWGCDVQECIPVAIRPRKNTSDGKRPKTGAAASLEDDPKEWSLSLLADLAMLSRSTTGKLTLAQSLLQTAVRERQSGMFANQPRTTAGLVRGDVQRAVESLKPSAPERNDRPPGKTDATQPSTSLNPEDADSDTSSLFVGAPVTQPAQVKSDSGEAATQSPEPADLPAQAIEPAPQTTELPTQAIEPAPGAIKPAPQGMAPPPQDMKSPHQVTERSVRPTTSPAYDGATLDLEISILEHRSRASKLKADAERHEAAAKKRDAEAAELDSNIDELRLKRLGLVK